MIYTLKPSFNSGISAIVSPSTTGDKDSPTTMLTFDLEIGDDFSGGPEGPDMPDLMLPILFDANLSHLQKSGESGLLISNRLKSILNKYQLPPSEIYNTLITYQNKSTPLDYYYLVFKGKLLDFTDVKHTTFRVVNRADKKNTLKTLDNIPSQEALDELKKEFRKEGKMILSNVFRLPIHYDLWWGGTSFVYISENLKAGLEENSISGLEITPFLNFNIEHIGDKNL